MVELKTSDQYQATGIVSTRIHTCIRDIDIYQKLKHKVLKSLTMTSRSLRWVGMEQHETSDQFLTTDKVSTRSINMFKRYNLTKTLTKIFNI